ncbi:hypothetical protein TNIN_314131 [Trichonephila inaurata madagascariensis]|uniref:Uncharacterized protein n=1 Tax=Trichonephila inaurata madagascariensis TaxID=2747483 RepID=A0A8X7CPD4_9ARAC|nr:hypothetical protein TNIN_314131 [Trichonephila inaurata madagascariensis]
MGVLFSGETDFTFDKTTLRMIIPLVKNCRRSYNRDATEISRVPNDSADSQINASPKTNRSNISQQFQVPIETFAEQEILWMKASRNIRSLLNRTIERTLTNIF